MEGLTEHPMPRRGSVMGQRRGSTMAQQARPRKIGRTELRVMARLINNELGGGIGGGRAELVGPDLKKGWASNRRNAYVFDVGQHINLGLHRTELWAPKEHRRASRLIQEHDLKKLRQKAAKESEVKHLNIIMNPRYF